MRRLAPFPLLSCGLLATWLLLNQTLAAADVVAGAVLSFALPWVLALLVTERARPRRPGAIVRLSLLVFGDIVRSNVAVASIILRPGRRVRTAGFVTIPLRLRDPYGLAVLACIITATPGTLWARFDPPSGILVIHVLDIGDESDWIRAIKERYERPLLEIFA
jgi:multicomponent K+:H+ antiporter subunit E